jgi:crotonobetainyl-CoA:carnitine CoA-transferase CaiB-like acyl-CoA transferase
MKDIGDDPHVKERKTLLDIKDPVTGKNLRMPDVPIRMPSAPGAIRFPGLPYGSANEVVLADLLGYSPAKIEELKQKKVI